MLLRRLLRNRRWQLILLLLVISIAIVNITIKNDFIFNSIEIPVITLLSPVQEVLSRQVSLLKKN